jgi:hypothetical protein
VVLEKGKNREKKNKRKGRQYTYDVGIWRRQRREKKDKSLGCILSRKAKQQGHEKNSQQQN